MSRSSQPGAVSLRVSVTDRCPLRCLYCMPPEGVRLFDHADVLRYEEVLRFVRVLKNHFGLTKVHVTGGEPLVRRGIVDFVRMLAGEGIDDLAVTTNGQLLADLAADLRRAGLHRVNVSLDSIDAETYRTITRGGDVRRTIAGIEAAAAAGLAPVKLNATVLRGVNDRHVPDLARYAMRRNMTVRFIELMPIGQASAGAERWFVSSREVLDRLGREFQVTPLPRRPGSSSRQFRLAGPAGENGIVGVISSASDPFCGDCNRLRLTATGELVGCLARNDAENILPLLRTDGRIDEREILARARAALGRKRTGPTFATGRNMAKLGG